MREQSLPAPTLEKALEIALNAWTVGPLTQSEEPSDELPSAEAIAKAREEQLAASSIEAAILTDTGAQTVTWRSLRDTEIRPQLEKR